jgi:hypothetical protein
VSSSHVEHSFEFRRPFDRTGQIVYPDSDTMTGSGQDNLAGHSRRVRLHNQQPDNSPDEEDALDQGSDENEEDNVNKRLDDQEAAMAKRAEYDALDADSEQMMKVTRLLEASGSSDIRKRAAQATLDAIEQDIAKLGAGKPVRYPHGTDTDLQDHSNMTAEATRTSERGQASRQLSVTAAVQTPGRHPFDDRIDAVQRRDGGSRLAAMSTARQEFPAEYSSYQAFTASSSAQQQQGGRRDNEGLGKSASPSYESALSAQIAKGFSPWVAAQRLANWGIMPDDEIAKERDTYESLREVAQSIVDKDGGSRCEALQKARYSRPEIYRALQGRV